MNNLYRYYIVTEQAGAGWVRKFFRDNSDGGPEEDKNCTTELSPANNPQARPTNLSASFVLNEQKKKLIDEDQKQSRIPNTVSIFICDATNDKLIYSNHPAGQAKIGQVWNTPVMLNTLGLTFHIPSDRPGRPRG